MDQYKWDDIPEEKLTELASRRVIHTERMTVARLRLRKGAVVPMHDHVNEQITMLESGELRFEVDGAETILRAGDVLRIPPGARHKVETMEDSLAVDVFTPAREDWIRGDDAYLRG